MRNGGGIEMTSLLTNKYSHLPLCITLLSAGEFGQLCIQNILILTATNVLVNAQVKTHESFTHESVVLKVRFSMTQERVHGVKRILSGVWFITNTVGKIGDVDSS